MLFIIETEASLVIYGEMDSLKICIQIELVPYWLKIERRTNVILPTHYGNIEQWISRFHHIQGDEIWGGGDLQKTDAFKMQKTYRSTLAC